MSGFKPYPAYKDSGVEWQGAVPAEWPRSTLKYLADYQNGYPFKPDDWGEEGLPIIRISQLTGDTAPNYYSGELDCRVKVGDGDLLFSWSATIDSFIWAGGSAWLNQHIFKVTPTDEADQKFLFYLIKLVAPKLADFDAHGSTMRHIKKESLSERLHVPTLAEQTQIARFLDHETARIDALIEEQQRLIKLLKEKRQAVISHAVTKGLDPTVPMKDSGVEWLGEVPAHWEVVRLGAVYSEAVEKGVAELPVLRVSIHHGVSDKELTEEESDRKITRIEDREKYKRVRPGDLVYNMMRAWQGGFGAVMVDGLVSPAYVVARPVTGGDFSRYVEQLLRTECAVEEMRKNSYGITDFRLRLYWDQFKSIRIVIPPELERQQIMARLDALAAETKSLQDEADHLVTVLQERRSALISAAVTGKIDVRNWQPPARAQAPECEEVEAV